MSKSSRDAFRDIVKKARSSTRPVSESRVFNDSITGSLDGMVMRADTEPHEHDLQRRFRPIFGKTHINQTLIGCHPDFRHLEGTDEKEYHHVCSLFLDIKNSTRLSFLYSLEDVAWIKNSILKAASEVIRSMDGYVHRFMGDAVLAFFGNKQDSKDDSVVNAINCIAILESLMTGTIIPVLEDEGFKGSDLGFRIGLDFGSDDKVLWASYGYSEVREVTATSFYVDVASKLQSMARKNRAMMGDSIISHIDFPREFLKKKIQIADGVSTEIDVLDRIYTQRDGTELRYKVRELNHAEYRDLLPFDAAEKQTFQGSKAVGNPYLSFKCYVDDPRGKVEYPSVSKVLPKRATIYFKLTALRGLANDQIFPLTAKFTKRNYGAEASIEEDAGVFPKGEHQINIKQNDGRSYFDIGDSYEFNESTKYRGLHTMEAEVRNGRGDIVYRQKIGIYIE